ncbi:MAG TPA: adenylate/guanylate cyclase domain-containing protein [Candidatus Udaeobacter sp.]|nr:adenylate/guanylate cyclase domain-containing protein [Candidatus Udaeobacter sp.]
MSAEIKKEIQLEIAHVLFIDIVGYSRLSINDQHAAVEELNQIVRASEQFQRAEAASRLLKIPTGDGMALVFYMSPEAPAQCAVEISRALKEHPGLQLRMGIHSGPVSGVVDVNERANIAGAGINIAQRVMDCGDAGHILISKHAAEDLEEYEHWQPHLHDLGECEVKHGVRVHVVNLYTDELGNPEMPEKFKQAAGTRRAAAATSGPTERPTARRLAMIGAVLLMIAAVVSGLFVFLAKRSPIRAITSTVAPEKSIAVLPFENLSEEKANAYFADGIQEEILTRLAKIADLKVISRTSTQQFQSKPANLSEIAKQLGVANILEGSVQRLADQVRVNVQLIQVASDSHLWADTYDRKLVDIFGVESEIAKAIADALQAKLTGGEQRALAVKPTNNSEAYDAYLRGLALEARTTFRPDDLEKAVGFYERAVQLDPAFALAWARLSRANAHVYFGGLDKTPARRDATERALNTAQKLQPNSPETLLAQAYYQYWVLRDYDLSKGTFGRVRELLPSSSDVPGALALIARRQGHWDESVSYWEQTLVLDPRNTEWLALAAETYAMLRQFPAALKTYDRLLDIVPNDPDTVASKAKIYQAEGNLEQAGKLLAGVNAQTPSLNAFLAKMNQLFLERHFDEAIRLIHSRLTESRDLSVIERFLNPFFLALAQEYAGDIAGARATAQQMLGPLETLCKKDPDNPNFVSVLSLIHAVLGQKDAAIKEAERAITLLPSGKDAVDGPRQAENLASVEVLVGDKNRAIPRLQRLLEIPYTNFLTPALLRLDPKWDPLRGDPAFQKLCEEKQP